MNEVLLYIFISILLFAPVGVALYYLMTSFRLLAKARHTHNSSKRKSAITAMLVSFIFLAALITAYYFLLLYFDLY